MNDGDAEALRALKDQLKLKKIVAQAGPKRPSGTRVVKVGVFFTRELKVGEKVNVRLSPVISGDNGVAPVPLPPHQRDQEVVTSGATIAFDLGNSGTILIVMAAASLAGASLGSDSDWTWLDD